MELQVTRCNYWILGAKIANEKKKTSTNINNRIMNYGVDDERFVLINLCNWNTEVEEVETLCELDQLLSKFFINSCKKSVYAGTFKQFFNSNLETSRSNSSLKTKSMSIIIESESGHIEKTLSFSKTLYFHKKAFFRTATKLIRLYFYLQN